MKKQMLFVILACGLPILFGCVSNPKPTLKPSQCLSANWQTIGYQDGLLGVLSDHFSKHQQACQPIATALNDWQKGYEQGLQKYCTPLRAYQLGREGFAFNNVCPQHLLLDLLKSHDEGYTHYQRERMLQQMYDDWYPFGFGRWAYPYSRFYPHTPTLPKYVDLPEPKTANSP